MQTVSVFCGFVVSLLVKYELCWVSWCCRWTRGECWV